MNPRRARFGDASRAAGNDDAADARQLPGWRIDRKDVTLNTGLSHPPREQMAILTARVENCYAVHEGIIVDSRQSAVGSRQSAVGGRQSAVGSQQSAVGSQPSAVAAMAWDVPSAAI